MTSKQFYDWQTSGGTDDVGDDQLQQRRKGWSMPPYKATRGTLYKYIKNVKDASQGCVTDE